MTSATEFLKPRAVKVQPLGTNRARVTVEPFDGGVQEPSNLLGVQVRVL